MRVQRAKELKDMLILEVVRVWKGDFNMNIPINIYTLLIVSTLKIPGVCLILVYNLILYK